MGGGSCLLLNLTPMSAAACPLPDLGSLLQQGLCNHLSFPLWEPDTAMDCNLESISPTGLVWNRKGAFQTFIDKRKIRCTKQRKKKIVGSSTIAKMHLAKHSCKNKFAFFVFGCFHKNFPKIEFKSPNTKTSALQIC